MKPSTKQYLVRLRLRLELERTAMRAAHLGYWGVWRNVQRKLRRMK